MRLSVGVIEAVDKPTDWCGPIVVVPNKSGDVWICVDLTKLNEAVRREKYIIPKVESTRKYRVEKAHLHETRCKFRISSSRPQRGQ